MGYGEDFVYGSGFYKGTDFDFTADDTSGHTPQNIQFTLSSNVADAYNLIWYFGDGNTSTDKNPTHTYGMPGVYTVRVKGIGSQYDVTKTDYVTITDFDTDLDVSGTTKSYRMALESHQGYDWSENIDGDWVFPPGRTHSFEIKDNNEVYHTCMVDLDDNKLYIIDTKTCPSTLSSGKVFLDKVNVSGTGGTSINTDILFKEDLAEAEKYTIESIESQYYVRPYSETDGYASGLKVSGSAYINGNPTTTTAEAKDIGPSGITVYDRKVEARRIQHQFKTNDARIRLVGRQHDYIAKDIVYDRSNTISTEGDNQAELSDLAMWVTRGDDPTTERVSGTTVDGLDASITGPDSREVSAFSVSGAVTLPSLSDTSAKTFTIWSSGTISGVSVGGTDITLTEYNSDGDWSMYTSSGVSSSGSVVLTPSGTINVFDIRMMYGDLTPQFEYYFDDITENSGDNVLPLG